MYILEAGIRQKLDNRLCSTFRHVYLIPPSVSCTYKLKQSFGKSLSFELLFSSHVLHSVGTQSSQACFVAELFQVITTTDGTKP